MLTYPRNLEGSITILGENGSVKIGGTAVNRVEHWTFADYDDDDKLSSRRTRTRRPCTDSGTRGITGTCSACCAARRRPIPMAGRGGSRWS